MDVSQELPDEVWLVISKAVMDDEEDKFTGQPVTPPATPPDEISHAMFARLASWSDRQESIADA